MHVAVAITPVEWLLAESSVGIEEAVNLGNVHPAQQVRIVRVIPTTITCDAVDERVHVADAVDRSLCFFGRAERGDGEEVSRALESAPRIVAVIGVLGDPGHGERVQRLNEQCAQPADEH